MYDIDYQSRFKKDIKRCEKQGLDIEKFKTLAGLLKNGLSLPKKYLDHPLSGNLSGYRDCHLEPDWLVIYKVDKKEKTITLVRTGSHAELFK